MPISIASRLLAACLLLTLAGCAERGPDGPTLNGTSPEQDGTLEPNTTTRPSTDVTPEEQFDPNATLEPDATLQPDTTTTGERR